MRLLYGMVLLGSLLLSRGASAQAPKGVDSLLLARHFLFLVQSSTTYNGQFRQETPGFFFVRLAGDSLTSYLPYYGRLYSMPTALQTIHSPYDFVSTGFTYDLHPQRKGKDLEVLFRDQKDGRIYRFSIGSSGDATLSVRSSFRDLMTYSGTIVAPDR